MISHDLALSSTLSDPRRRDVSRQALSSRATRREISNVPATLHANPDRGDSRSAARAQLATTGGDLTNPSIRRRDARSARAGRATRKQLCRRRQARPGKRAPTALVRAGRAGRDCRSGLRWPRAEAGNSRRARNECLPPRLKAASSKVGPVPIGDFIRSPASARASRFAATSMPMRLRGLQVVTSFDLVGCCTGISAAATRP